MHLTTTILSHSTGKLYGNQNDVVDIVSRNGHVAIVESALGNRFPVLVELLSEDMVETQAALVKPKNEAPRTQTRPLTQIEKLQLEYLNSKK